LNAGVVKDVLRKVLVFVIGVCLVGSEEYMELCLKKKKSIRVTGIIKKGTVFLMKNGVNVSSVSYFIKDYLT
jgi:hypothetical protein